MSANVALSDTFDQWRVKTNELLAMTQSGGMANFVKLTDTTNSTSNTTGSIITTGGVGVSKSMVVGENLNVHGNIHANGAISADGNLTLGSDTTDSVDFNADIASHLIPNVDSTYDIGNTTFYWANAFINTVDLQQEASAGKPGLKVTGLDADAKLVEIVGSQTTNDILYVNATALTTGSAFVINQDLNSTATRTLAKVIQNHASATGATGVSIQMDAGRGLFIDTNLAAGGYSLEIDAQQDTTNTAKIASAATTGTILDIQAEAITTGRGINIYDDSATTGSALYIDSDSSSTGTRNTAAIIQNHASATGATALWVQNDSTGMGIDIRGGVGTGGAPAGKLRLSTAETSVVDGDVLGMIQFIAPLSGTAGQDAVEIAACIQAEADGTFGAAVNATELVFKTAASEAATEKLRITSDGKLGIGVTDPSDQIEVYKTGADSVISVTAASAANDAMLKLRTGDADDWGIYADGSATGDPLIFYDYGSTDYTLSLNQGKVGIGLTAPSELVTVQGTGAAGDGGIRIDSYSTTAANGSKLYLAHSDHGTEGTHGAVDQHDLLGEILFQGSSGTGWYTGSAVKGWADDTWASNEYGSYLSFYSTDIDTNTLDERMRITSSGNVGIGETVPLAPLHVRSADSGASVVSTADDFVVEGSAHTGMTILAGTAHTATIAFGDSGDNDIGQIGYDHSGDNLFFKAGAAEVMTATSGAVVVNEASGDIDFRVESNGNTHALFVDAGGEVVSCFQSSPLSGSKLDVGGGLAITGEISTPSQPADGKGMLYTKTDGKIYWRSYDIAETDLTGGGAELSAENAWTAQQTFDDQALTSGTSISWNANTAQVATLALAHNATVATATNHKAGGVYIMRVTQASSPKTLAWSTGYKWPGNTAPTMTSTGGAVDIFTFTSDGTYMYGSFSGSQNYT